jgi:hypothetical protein
MKIQKLISIVVIIFTSIIFIGCFESVKGKWSESDKQKVSTVLEKEFGLSVFGENKTKWI